MNHTYLLSLIFTSAEATACLILARYLRLHRREVKDRSRWLLALGALLCGLLSALTVIANVFFPLAAQEGAPMLLPWIGFVYLTMHIIMTLYPITVVAPKWLTPRRAFFIFLPIAIFALLFLGFSLFGKWTMLSTPASVWENVLKPDVFCRLAALFTMVPYCILLLFLPYNYRHSSANTKWIINYCFSLTALCCAHIVFMLTQWAPLIVILPVLATAFYLFSTDFELEERLMPEEDVLPQETADTDTPEITKPVPDTIELWKRICMMMEQEEAWRNPDLTLVSLAQQCATNITYLNREIQEKTGGGFKEMVNSKRIECVANQLRNDPDIDIQAAFFNAGYRSRSTAWRHFKEIMGVTPTEFRQSLKDEKETD